METREMHLNGMPVLVSRMRTVVVGSGCAGLNAADWLWELGRRDFVCLTEGWNCGTSRNTGSDKQTYYKLSLSGDDGDSVGELAKTLMQEGVNGDTALCEAAGSVQCFMKLALAGVPFPRNAFGEYVGYKTDHDPRSRATSAGPLTSRYMTEALEKRVLEKNIPVLDNCLAFQLIVDHGKVKGLLCLDKKQRVLRFILCRNVVLATGGPADLYEDSVYPSSQRGMSGLALEAGAAGANLNQWQYGLASVSFRWNVSGSYQQVLPRIFSRDEQGNEREFLADTLGAAKALEMTFLKGYEWPFDTQRVQGSSLVDLLVYAETQAGRKVYLDYTRNPRGLGKNLEGAGKTALEYLTRSAATQDTPFQRLTAMNEPAAALYLAHHIDLQKEPLEIRLCAQHHNGGLAVDANWQTTIQGLYAAGESAGTFGVGRPGGSALNSTQVGSLRAAEAIAQEQDIPFTDWSEAETLLSAHPPLSLSGDVKQYYRWAKHEFSRIGAAVRDGDALKQHESLLTDLLREHTAVLDTITGESEERLRLRDLLITQQAVADAMCAAITEFGSTGAGLAVDAAASPIHPALSLAMIPHKVHSRSLVANTRHDGHGFVTDFVLARPLPERDLWFETVWKQQRDRAMKINSVK